MATSVPVGSTIAVVGAGSPPYFAGGQVFAHSPNTGAVTPKKPPPPNPGPFLQRLEIYMSKCIGRDMTLKTIVYFLRFAVLYTQDAKREAMLNTLVLNIIDCRMLYNSAKFWGTFRTCINTVREDKSEAFIKICTILSFFFRSLEQLSGDLGYLQKNVFTESWSRERCSWHYKFNKSISLMCCAIVESFKVLDLSEKLARARHRHEVRAIHVRAPSDSCSPTSGDQRPMPTAVAPGGLNGFLEPNAAHDSTAHGMKRSLSGAFNEWDYPALPEDLGLVRRTPPQSPIDDVDSHVWPKHIPEHELERQRRRSVMFLARNIADIVVYSQWISWYHPWKHLEYACGVFSGAVGMYLVWEDSVVKPPPAPTASPSEEKPKKA
jgi:hypothetical protein